MRIVRYVLAGVLVLAVCVWLAPAGLDRARVLFEESGLQVGALPRLAQDRVSHRAALAPR